MKIKSLKKIKICPALIILLIVWLAMVLFFWRYGKTYLDSDMASEMVLAKLLNDEGTLLSKNWFYSSEIRIFCQEFFFKIGLLLFPQDWHLVRTLAQAIQLLLIAISYLYMTEPLGNREKNVYFATILLCPFGFWQLYHNTFDGFYLLHMIFFMVCVGLIYRICLYPGKNMLRLTLLGLICFEQGLEGVRIIMNLSAPMVLAAVLFFYFKICEIGNIHNREKYKKEIRLFIASIVGAVCSFVGYLINAKVLKNLYHFNIQNEVHFTAGSETTWSKLSFSKLLDVCSTFLRLFGYPVDDNSPNLPKVFSTNGLLSVFSIVLICFVLLSLARTACRFKSFSTENQLVILTCDACLLVLVATFTLTESEYNGSYFLPMLPAVVMLLSVEWEYERYHIKEGKKFVAAILGISLLCCSVSTTRAFLVNTPRAVAGMEEITETIVDNGYTQGAATFWNSNVVTELSDGKVEMWTIDDYPDHEIDPWLQKVSHVESRPQGRGVFVLENRSEYAAFFLTYPGAELIYDDGTIQVVGVEDMNAVFDGLDELEAS